jgi:hypothetical protein
LLVLIDTATGLPITPNGGDITCAWASGNVFTICEGLSERERGLVQQFLDFLNSVWGQIFGDDALPAPSLSFA